MGLSVPRDDSIVIIDLQTVKKITWDQPSIYTGFNEIVTNRKKSDIKHPQNIYQLESWSKNMNIHFYISLDLYCENDIE